MNFSAEMQTRLVALLLASELSEVETKEKDYLHAAAEQAGKLDEVTAAVEAAKESDEKEPASAKPGMLSGAKALLADKSALVSEVSSLKTQLGQSKAEAARLSSELSKATGDLAALTTERDELKAKFDQAEKDKKTVNDKTADELAGLGVPEKDLPSKDTTGKSTSIEDIEEQMKATEDPKEKGRLARQLKAARLSLN